MSIVIPAIENPQIMVPEYELTRDQIMTNIVFHANSQDYIVFGGYVRDVHILKCSANDIDIPVESDSDEIARNCLNI